MSNTNATSTERVSVPRILAELLMLGHQRKLPDPIDMYATYENGCASVKLASFADQALWSDALGAKPSTEFTSKDGMRFCRVHGTRRDGWFITVDASEPAVPSHTELPGETLAVLEDIAPPARQIAIVSEERAEEILAGLNGFIKRDGSQVVDYGRDLAVSWAREQPEVVSAGFDAVDDEGLAELADGTMVVWAQDFKRWCFAVPTGTAS